MKSKRDFLAVEDARNLLAGLREGAAFRDYLQGRLRLVLPALGLFVLIGFACAAATAVFFAELSNWLTLPAFLLAPAVLIASLYVQGLAFLSWLERRALATALGHRPRGIGELPRVPWPLAAVALFFPLVLLAAVAPLAALILVGLAALVPFAYAKLDRARPKSRLTRSRAAV